MNPSNRMYRPDEALWQRALDGDRDAFEEAVAPLQGDLLQFARRQIGLQRRLGQLKPDELTPEELFGDGLVIAYERRHRFDPKRMRLRAWLLGLQHRALVRTLQQEARYAARNAISLDEEVPQNESQDAVEEALYEFRMPFDVTTYEELIAGSAPADVEIELGTDGHELAGLTDDERALLEAADLDLPPAVRQVVLLHDEYRMNLAEVAQILDASLKDTAEALNLARTTLREQLGSRDDLGGDEDDAIDSYTGDPVE